MIIFKLVPRPRLARRHPLPARMWPQRVRVKLARIIASLWWWSPYSCASSSVFYPSCWPMWWMTSARHHIPGCISLPRLWHGRPVSLIRLSMPPAIEITGKLYFRSVYRLRCHLKQYCDIDRHRLHIISKLKYLNFPAYRVAYYKIFALLKFWGEPLSPMPSRNYHQSKNSKELSGVIRSTPLFHAVQKNSINQMCQTYSVWVFLYSNNFAIHNTLLIINNINFFLIYI